MCPNCGNPVQPGTAVCPYCNAVLQQNQPMPQQPAMNQVPMQQPMPQQPVGPVPVQPMNGPMPMYNQPPKKNNTVLFIVIGVVVLIVILVVVFLSGTKKLSCKKGSETITIRYTDDKIVGCAHIGGTAKCDLDQLQGLAAQYGVDKVIDSLNSELSNLGYTCTRG